MNQSNENISIAEAEEAEVIQDTADDSPAPKKSRLKLYILAVFIVAAAIAAVVYVPDLSDRLQSLWVQNSTQPPESSDTVTIEPQFEAALESPVTSPEDTPLQVDADLETQTETVPAPTFEDGAVPVAEEATPPAAVAIENAGELIGVVQQLQQQVSALQQIVTQMHAQQLQQSQQQIAAQLFALLLKAGDSHLSDSAIAWKSISLLPLISEERRQLALQAYEQITTLQQQMLSTSEEISALQAQLNQQMEPAAQTADMAVTDPYQEVVAGDISWIDWLKQQFKVSKIDPHALVTPDDPYADTRQLIGELQRLKEAVSLGRWDNIQNLNRLFYQLEQRGMETSLSHETLNGFKQVQQTWQNEAKAWMEQL